ncbi:RNA polymerase II-associated protein [Thelephora ganbajun]|uniref:RNA polymerase II-associated protein n=1 Tax=Thelephora ganbajun TaxID=370292 RepID=A0ACB6ZDU7_THEGA|nr:RNA polymerase II-associated protein [Thelephora ganbajun]
MSDPKAPKTIELDLLNEVVTIELDELEEDATNLILVLNESECKVWVWTKLAQEYWQRGYHDEAEKIALAAITKLSPSDPGSLAPIHSFLANVHIFRARQAPKLILPNPRQDDMTSQKTKEEHYKEAAMCINASDNALRQSEGDGGVLFLLARGIHQMATRSMEDALRCFDAVLSTHPTNVIALLGKARILYARRQHAQALKLFQDVLRYNPECKPDPRIGIGLCFWALDQRPRAKAAWQRSLEVNPNNSSAQLLLGLEAINTSKNEKLPEDERRSAFVSGTKLIELAFKANQRNSAAANALCELFLRKGNYARAMKLAERTIQFADTLTILTDGYIKAGRVSHAEGSILDATRHLTEATKAPVVNAIAAIGLAQIQLKTDEIPAAIHTLDSLLQSSSNQTSVEGTAMLASLRAHPRPGVSASEFAKEKERARELFEKVIKELHLPEDSARVSTSTNGVGPSRLNKSARNLTEDVEMHVEIAKLWQDDNVDIVKRAVQEALQINEATHKVEPKLMNNLGVLDHLEGNLQQARAAYERALTSNTAAALPDTDAVSTTILYNLARVYEGQGELDRAQEAYEKLLAHHPEYVDAKIRLADLAATLNNGNEAHDLLKQALASQPNNLNIRAFYTRFLIQSNLHKHAKDFVFATLRDHDKHDIYSLCASGWIMYHQARENRDIKQIEERKRGFQRSAEFYEKALQLDPLCAVAAQGLAVVIAEDALGTMGGALSQTPVPGSDEVLKRYNNARDALEVFSKIKESLNDGSVYVNMGHCYFAREEYDRAIESYETASSRFYNGQNGSLLMCLCRSHYAKATKDQSYAEMNLALQCAQKALHIAPHDKAVLYNIAMMMQKAAEMMFSIPLAKRQIADLESAIEQGAKAQRLFTSLAADESPSLPYDRNIADQRRKYGDNMMRKADEHLQTQRQYDTEKAEKLAYAKKLRQEEKEKQEALEREEARKRRENAEALAAERRKARETALEWTKDIKVDSDEEKEKKPKKQRRVKTEVGSGNEGEPEPPKKKRRGKLKKIGGDSGSEREGLFTDEEGGVDSKPAKKRSSKKRVIREDDDGEQVSAPARKKQYKSKELISDSDEEME